LQNEIYLAGVLVSGVNEAADDASAAAFQCAWPNAPNGRIA
jgi:hypothetical protein